MLRNATSGDIFQRSKDNKNHIIKLHKKQI